MPFSTLVHDRCIDELNTLEYFFTFILSSYNLNVFHLCIPPITFSHYLVLSIQDTPTLVIFCGEIWLKNPTTDENK